MNTYELANQIRIKTCEMILNLGFGHLCGSLSIVEVLAVLYNEIMHIDPSNPHSMDRDWFVLSKGHGGPAYYATLALMGYFDPEELLTLNQYNTNLPSHPDHTKTIGVDATTGSLGQGVSQAVGIAKGLLIQGVQRHVYCIVGDGEMNEGQVYEALNFAAHKKLHNFTVILDNNKKQLDGYTKDVSMDIDYKKLFMVMGFDAHCVGGQHVEAIKQALRQRSNKPQAVILDTIKGQGLPYFEKLFDNHHLRLTSDQMDILRHEINRLKGHRYG